MNLIKITPTDIWLTFFVGFKFFCWDFIPIGHICLLSKFQAYKSILTILKLILTICWDSFLFEVYSSNTDCGRDFLLGTGATQVECGCVK